MARSRLGGSSRSSRSPTLSEQKRAGEHLRKANSKLEERQKEIEEELGLTVRVQELNVPVLVGLSDGAREFVGVRQIAAFVRSLLEEFGFDRSHGDIFRHLGFA